MLQQKYDTIIVGTGAAGLFAALHLPKDSKVLMITKDTILNSDSYLAQGGISALKNQEDYDTYFEDTLKAGRYENNKEAVKEMILSSKDIIDELKKLYVDFDRDEKGDISFTREGGHSIFRILHHKDVTGKYIVLKLYEQVQKRDNVEIVEHFQMLDLLCTKYGCNGIVGIDEKKQLHTLYSKQVILATGGLGGLFKNSTNYPHIAGDSFSIALRHQIQLENIHYIQIHPTVLHSKKPGRRFLISESVRGEGALLYNQEGKRFIDELLPRDVVATAIHNEMEREHTDHVFLSFEKISREKILNHFPNIYANCMEEGYDATKEFIPVTPAQHYLMGGIQTDIYGHTSMEHLYAVGETACNGVHGANRLASNSLLESLVFAKNAASQIKERAAIVEQEFEKHFSEIQEECDAYFQMNKTYYLDTEEYQSQNRKLLLQEIKRKDREFYDKWCNI